MNNLMQFFAFAHLPVHLKGPSKACAELAEEMDDALPESAEKTAGLRKLLEAKDCFVRAALTQHQRAEAIRGGASAEEVNQAAKAGFAEAKAAQG